MHSPSSISIRGRTVELTVESGTVAGIRKLSVTHVSGSSNSVSSSVERTTEFGLLGTDGVERAHHFPNHDAFLRDGHRVSLIHASYRRKAWAWLVNHDTRQSSIGSDPDDYVIRLGLVHRFGWFGSVLLIGALGLLSGGGLLPYAVGGAIAYAVIQTWRAWRIWKRHLRPTFEQMERDLLSRTDEIFEEAAASRTRPGASETSTPVRSALVPPPLPPGPPPLPAAKPRHIFVALQGQQTGPHSTEDVKRMLARQEATEKTLCWEEGMNDWEPIGRKRLG